MLRWLSVGRVRRYCLYSPRKCFVLLILTALLVSVVLMWNQVSPVKEYPPTSALHSPSHPRNLSLIPEFLLPDLITFLLKPRNHVCGWWTKKKETRDRFAELLEARPDGEEAEIPPAIPSHGVIFVPVLADEKEARMMIRRTWGSGAWQSNSRCRVVFVSGRNGKTAPLLNESNLFGDILQLNLDETDDQFHPQLLPSALGWIEQTCSTSIPSFIIKAKATMFINRDGLLRWISRMSDGVHGQYQLESFNPDFIAIKGPDTVENLLLTIPRVKYISLEDTSFLTHHVADAAGILRYDTVYFNELNWYGADGCWLVQHMIFSDLTMDAFEPLWIRITDKERMKCHKGDGCCEDNWSLIMTLGPVWIVMLLLQLSILHSDFWSSLTLFCSDLCSTMDSGIDDELDSDAEDGSSVRLYDSDEEKDRREHSFFDIHRPNDSGITTGNVDRY